MIQSAAEMRYPTEKEIITNAVLPMLLRALRKALGLTGAEMSQLTGVSRQSLCYYEHGKAMPSVDTMQRYCAAVNTVLEQRKRRAVKSKSSSNK